MLLLLLQEAKLDLRLGRLLLLLDLLSGRRKQLLQLCYLVVGDGTHGLELAQDDLVLKNALQCLKHGR